MGDTEESSDLREITEEEVAQHNSAESTWMIFQDKVLDVTSFLEEHPGGDEVMLEAAGEDSTERFKDVGHSDDALEMTNQYVIGKLKASPKTETSHRHLSKCLLVSSAIIVVILGVVVAYRRCSK